MYSKVGTIAEPAGAASVAALEVIKVRLKTIVCIISGGNNDINRMPEMEGGVLIYDDGIKHYYSCFPNVLVPFVIVK